MLKRWKYKMWYYTKGEAVQVAAKLRQKGSPATRIRRATNLNSPEAGGKYIYDVWYK